MPYALIVLAVVLLSCGESKTSSKNAGAESLSVAAPADASGATDPQAPTARIDKGDGLIVDVLQEGSGRVVQLGDTVTLDCTITYMPSLTKKDEKKDEAKETKDGKAPAKGDAKKPIGKGSKKPVDKKGDEAKKTDEAKGDDTKPAANGAGEDHPKKSGDAKEDEKKDDEKGDAAKKDGEKKDAEKKDGEKKDGAKKDGEKGDAPKTDAAKTETPKTDEPPAKTGESADATKTDAAHKEGEPQDAAKTGADPAKPDAAKPDEKPADAKPPEPLKPVTVFASKSMLTPFTVKLSSDSKPKLVPGFLRGVEGLKVGTRARITVPAALAYGKDGSKSAGIPGDTPIEIEVLVKEARE